MSVGLTVGGWFASAFLQTLVEKASSYTLQQLGQWSDLHVAVGQLHSSLIMARTVLRLAERKQQRNKDDEELLRELLLRLKDAAYDAEDLFGDLDYEILCQANEASHNIFSSSISYAGNLLNSGDDDFAAKAHVVRERLDAVSNDMRDIIALLNLEECGRQHEMPARKRESSSLPTEPRMIGRDKEKEHLIRLLLSTADVSGSTTADRNVSVLPVVGMGGLGKTTLAQFVYQDPRVQNYFQLKMWVCVSNGPFDVQRLTRDIILELTKEKGRSNITTLTNLNSLQKHLKEKVSSKRYLLVLDDVWNGDRMDWESLFAPLQYGLQGSMIMVTTRSETVVRAMMGTLDPILLKGLPEDDYMEFFKTCAFGSENPKDRPEMEEIAERIAAKLKGSPLAAKTLGGSLNSNMDVRHWRNIMNSEIWQLQQYENDIMPVLRLSYQHLPLHLKPCFSICSIYPQDYCFKAKELVYLWMAQGFLVAPQANMLLEDVGKEYLHDLTSRSFFQKGRREGDYFQIHDHWEDDFQIHDLMHDLAKYVSKDDCFSIQKNDCPKSPSSIRHLSIKCTKNLGLLDEVMKSGYNFNKLRSLVIFNYIKPEFNSVIVRWLDRLQYIRVLYLSSQYPILEFPESIGNLKHLQFLKIPDSSFRSLPESFCRLYNLKFLDMKRCKVRNFPRGFANLINLRRIDVVNLDISEVTGIGKLTNLQYLNYFRVQKEHGHGIDELKNLKQLHGSLCIANLENVESREDACQANLDNKEYIDELTLQWSQRYTRIAGGSIDFSGDTEELEGLKPHRDLKKLKIRCYGGDQPPTWLHIETLPLLYSLSFEDCPNITDLELNSLPLLGGEGSVDQGIYARGSNSVRSSALSELYLDRCQSLEECLLPERLPSIKIIHIVNCRELVSLPVERFKNFISLEELSIVDCPKLTSSKKLELNPSIKVLELISCGELELSPPSCPQNRSSLIKLIISQSLHLKCLPGQLLHHMPALEILEISSCPELRSIGGLDALSSLKCLIIKGCPKLTDLESLPSEREVQRKDPFISDWTIEKTALLKQPFAHILSSFHLNLSIDCSEESVWFDEGDDQEWLQILTSLRSLTMFDCRNLRSLPTWLHRLTSLQALEIYGCPAIESLPENGLPTSLTRISFDEIHPMLRKQLEEKHRALMDPISLRLE